MFHSTQSSFVLCDYYNHVFSVFLLYSSRKWLFVANMQLLEKVRWKYWQNDYSWIGGGCFDFLRAACFGSSKEFREHGEKNERLRFCKGDLLWNKVAEKAFEYLMHLLIAILIGK